jgi:outer membrane protein assembly factor BamB
MSKFGRAERMKKNTILLLGILVGLTLVLSACVPGPRVTGSPGISLSDDQIFVAYGSQVYALNPETGAVAWYYPENGSAQVSFYAPPLVTDDFVYVGDVGTVFHKIDKQSGDPVWTFTEASDYYMGQAAEKDGVVYAPSNDGHLYAINADGSLKWSFETGHFLWAQPQIGEDAIFIGSMDHFVYALSEAGDELWSTKMDGAVVGSPSLSEDGSRLYVGSVGREMVALNTTNGSVIWAFSAESSIWGRALLANGTLYFGDSGGNLYALNPANGEELWRRNYPGAIVGGLSPLPDGIALVTESGSVRVLNYDGTTRWDASLAGNVFQSPAVNDQFFVVGVIDGDNLVYAYDLTGVQLWSTTPEK